MSATVRRVQLLKNPIFLNPVANDMSFMKPPFLDDVP